MIYVIGAADTDEPWVLNLDGYQNLTTAKRSIYWQIQFNPTGTWAIAELRDGKLIDRDTSKIYHPTQRPYTTEAWAAFKERTGV